MEYLLIIILPNHLIKPIDSHHSFLHVIWSTGRNKWSRINAALGKSLKFRQMCFIYFLITILLAFLFAFFPNVMHLKVENPFEFQSLKSKLMTKLLKHTNKGNMWKDKIWSVTVQKTRRAGQRGEFSVMEKFVAKAKGKRSEQSWPDCMALTIRQHSIFSMYAPG